MKNILNKTIGLMLIVSISFATFSCKDDKEEEVKGNADRTELTALLAEAQQLLTDATDDDYPEVNIAIFSKLMSDVTVAANNENLTQNQVNSIIIHLNNGISTFKSSAFGSIPELALVMSLNFEEENPNQLITSGIRELIAELKSGPSEIFGSNTKKPTYVEGVGGGKAIHFENGSHLEIASYTPTDFLGNTMTISTWVKPEVMKDANYVASMNYWENWKFEIQGGGKPFFTVKTTKGYVDADNEKDNSVSLGKWTHVVLTIDLLNGDLGMYVDGVLTIMWKKDGDKSKANLAGAMPPAYQSAIGKQLPFMIGAVTTYEEANATWTWTGWDTPSSWSYFSGAMDNFSVYNIALTNGQVAKLYKDQRPKN